MARTTCLMCGQPLPKPKWWQQLVGQPPTHDPNGPDGDACWYGFNALIGVKDPGPRPGKRGQS
jgi:hypothetical protein